MPAPPSLKERGGTLWSEIHSIYEFDAHETVMVEELCRTVDMIAALSDAIESDGVMLSGSQGQPVLNGAVAELRQQQQALARLLTVLNLGAAAGGVSLQSEITARAQRAANARWSKSKAVRRA